MAKKKVAIVLLSILAAALIAAMVFFIGSPGVFPWNFSQTSGASQTASEPAEFDADGITAIKIDLAKHDVTVLGTDSDKIRVEKTGAPKVSESVSGSELCIEEPGIQLFDFGPAGSVTVYVPQKSDLDIETASGNIIIESLEAGYIETATASGDITVKESKAGHIETDSASGDAKIAGTEAGSVESDSASGNITIDAIVSDSADADTMSGEVRMDLRDARPSSVIVNTVSGSVDLRFAENTEAAVKVSTVSGNVTNEIKQNSDADLKLVAETVSGSIRITAE